MHRGDFGDDWKEKDISSGRIQKHEFGFGEVETRYTGSENLNFWAFVNIERRESLTREAQGLQAIRAKLMVRCEK